MIDLEKDPGYGIVFQALIVWVIFELYFFVLLFFELEKGSWREIFLRGDIQAIIGALVFFGAVPVFIFTVLSLKKIGGVLNILIRNIGIVGLLIGILWATLIELEKFRVKVFSITVDPKAFITVLPFFAYVGSIIISVIGVSLYYRYKRKDQ